MCYDYRHLINTAELNKICFVQCRYCDYQKLAQSDTQYKTINTFDKETGCVYLQITKIYLVGSSTFSNLATV